MGYCSSMRSWRGVVGSTLVLFWTAVNVLDWLGRGESVVAKARRLARFMPPLIDVLSSPLIQLAALLVGMVLIFREGRSWRRALVGPLTLPAIAPEPQALAALKPYIDEHTVARVMVATLAQRPIARAIASLLTVSGLRVKVKTLPIEWGANQPFRGIEVRGNEAQKVAAVVSALKWQGYQDVRQVVEESLDRSEQHWIEMRIGRVVRGQS